MSAGAPQQQTSTKERRRGYRKRVDSSAVVRPCTSSGKQGKPQVVQVFELSMSGAAFSIDQKFTIGDIYRFAMRDGRQCGSRIEIRSCRQRPDGLFDVGGQFC